MPRNRMIKPEFWTSEQVLNCSRDARLLFIGLWNFADDNGVHPVSCITLKAEVFPADNLSIDEVKKLVSELIQQGLLREYAVDGKSFWLITGWQIHQKIEKPRYRYPLPESDLKSLPHSDTSAINQGSVDDNSATNRQLVDAEKKEKRKEKENYICEVETSPVTVPDPTHVASKQVFKYWQTIMDRPRAVLDDKRQRVITKALKSYSIEDLKHAIDGCKNTPYNMGKNDNGQIYDDICLILRDAEHIERFMNNAGCDSSLLNREKRNDLMAGVI